MSLRDRFQQLDAHWKFLLLLAPGLFFLLLAFHRLPLEEPIIEDFELGITQRSAETLTSGTLTLDGFSVGDSTGWKSESKQARLQINVLPGPWNRIDIELIGPSANLWSVAIRRDFQGQSFPRTKPGEKLSLIDADLPGYPGSWSPIRIDISPAGTVEQSQELARINLRVSQETGRELGASFAGYLALPILPLALASFLLFGGRRSIRQAAILGAGGGILAAIGSIWDIRILQWAAPITSAFLLGAGVRSLLERVLETDPDRRQNIGRRAEMLLAVAIILVAAHVRWDEFLTHRATPLLHDAAGYLEIAREGTFYTTSQSTAPWVREPLYPALLRAWLALMPDTIPSAKLFGIIPSLLLVLFTGLLGRRLIHPVVGWLAALWMAVNPYLAGLSILVLRDDLLALLILMMLMIPLYADQWRWGRSILTGFLGAALILIRLNNIALLIPFLAFEAYRRRWKPAEIAMVLAIAIPPVVPHLLYNAEVGEGDYMYSSNVHVRYYANRDNLGSEGFPASIIEWDKDPYAGSIMSTGDLFALYSPVEILTRTISGYTRIFLWYPHEHLFWGLEWLMLPGLLGAIWLFRRKAVWCTAAWYLMALFPVAFIATITLDSRLALPATPLILWLWAAGVWWPMLAIYTAIRSRITSS